MVFLRKLRLYCTSAFGTTVPSLLTLPLEGPTDVPLKRPVIIDNIKFHSRKSSRGAGPPTARQEDSLLRVPRALVCVVAAAAARHSDSVYGREKRRLVSACCECKRPGLQPRRAVMKRNKRVSDLETFPPKPLPRLLLAPSEREPIASTVDARLETRGAWSGGAAATVATFPLQRAAINFE